MLEHGLHDTKYRRPRGSAAVATLMWGIVSTLLLLGFTYSVVAIFSGWEFALRQFRQFWYYIVALALGFGVQVGLYVYLRTVVNHSSPGALTASGATSTAAMVSCCAHHIVDVLPVLGVAGVLSGLGQYQRQLYWVALGFNMIGIIYTANRMIAMRRHLWTSPA